MAIVRRVRVRAPRGQEACLDCQGDGCEACEETGFLPVGSAPAGRRHWRAPR